MPLRGSQRAAASSLEARRLFGAAVPHEEQGWDSASVGKAESERSSLENTIGVPVKELFKHTRGVFANLIKRFLRHVRSVRKSLPLDLDLDTVVTRADSAQRSCILICCRLGVLCVLEQARIYLLAIQ